MSEFKVKYVGENVPLPILILIGILLTLNCCCPCPLNVKPKLIRYAASCHPPTFKTLKLVPYGLVLATLKGPVIWDALIGF